MSLYIYFLFLLRYLTLGKGLVLASFIPSATSSPSWAPPQDGIVLQNTTTTTIDSRVDSILSFWFDPRYPYMRWFTADPAFDAEITTRFGSIVSLARTTTTLDHWAQSPQGCLALILLLDQFPRNIFRNSSDAYSSDPKALSFATRAVEQGLDRDVLLIQQVFVYLPYMHAENFLSQDTDVFLYQALAERCEPGAKDKEFLEQCVDFAVRHQKVILKFGRFPARNEVLHRQSTPEEIEFLKTHPDGY